MANRVVNTLLVEDNLLHTHVIKKMLEGVADKDSMWSAFRVLHAKDLASGLAYVEQEDVDVVLLDLSLPDSDGLSTLTRMYAQASDIPIVVLTGHDDRALAVRALREGAQDYLVKGVLDKDSLLRAARYAIERKRVEQALHRREAILEAVAFAAEGLFMPADWEHVIQDVLARVGQAAGVSRVYVFQNAKNDAGSLVMSQRYEWSAHGIAPQIDNPELQSVPYREAGFVRWEETLQRGEHIHGHVREFPPAEQKLLAAQDIRSLLVVPIFAGEAFWGFIGFDECSTEREWFSAEVDALKTAAGALGAAIQRRQAEEALRESEKRYALAARGANDGLWDWDLRTNAIYFSPRWKAMLGHRETEVGNDPQEWFTRTHPDDLERVKLEITAHLDGVTSHFEQEHRMLHADGTYRWVLSRGLAVRDDDGRVYRMAGSQTDITERKRAEEQLLHDALHDALTGLPNRALFMDRLGHAIERAKRHEEQLFAVLFLDLDRFKVVNDSLGHSIGDQLIVAAAHRLQDCLRAPDTVARLGGDEFAILLEDLHDPEAAIHIANRIRRKLTSPFELSEREVFITASIGIVLSEREYSKPEDILRDADIAMYRAKALGKTRYVVFDEEMRAHAVARLELETDLRQAIQREEFQVYYQPIVSLATGRVAGLEALVRWQHPERGLILPDVFIAVAEETGLINYIDQWVLRQACQQLRDWQQQFPTDPPLAISVNISGKQFVQPDLTQQIEHVLQETGLDAENLHLEITESVVMERAEVAAAILSQLRGLGIRVHIDDFGTGYSSLSYLNQFPIDALKIDRSFVSRSRGKSNNVEIIQTIVTLADELDMTVIAEGVESAEQAAYLEALGCGYAQGYLFSAPAEVDVIEKLIAKGPLVLT